MPEPDEVEKKDRSSVWKMLFETVEIHSGDKVLPIPKLMLPGIVLLIVVLATLWFLPKIGFHPFGDVVAVPRARAIQLEWTGRHIGETPEKEVVFRDDALGKEVLRSFASDRTTLDLRTTTAGAFVATLIFEPSALPPVVATLPSPWLVSPAWAEGQCVASPGEHSGKPESKPEPPDENGWYRSWLYWPDGCAGYYVLNLNGQYAADSEGNPQFTWAQCVH